VGQKILVVNVAAVAAVGCITICSSSSSSSSGGGSISSGFVVVNGIV